MSIQIITIAAFDAEEGVISLQGPDSATSILSTQVMQRWVDMTPLAPAFRDTAEFTEDDAVRMQEFLADSPKRVRPHRAVTEDNDSTLY